MQPIYDESYEMMVENVQVSLPHGEYFPVKITTSRGVIHYRYYPVNDAEKAVIWVGGVGGDWDTPAQGLYPRLCEDLRKDKIASLRVRYRYSTNLEESILDVLAGLIYLQDEGIEDFALVGHSFGGAVVIQAAAQCPNVRTVITLATQAYGTDAAPELATSCSLLLIHGLEDQVLPANCSQRVYQMALEPKQLRLYPNANHGLEEVAQEVYQLVKDWLIKELNHPEFSL